MKPRSELHRQLVSGTLSRAGAILSLALLAPAASNAATIYTETFSTGGANATMGSIGWTAYQNNGTDLTAVTTPSLAYRASASALIASSGSVFSTHVALLSDAGSIDPADYENDLAVSFTENATDEGTKSSAMGWRVLATVGTTIYVSDFFQFSSTFTTHTVTVSGNVWHVWTGETDLSDGFNITNISGTAGNLAAGTISGIGILAIDGNGNNDRMRLTDFSITATPVPEPRAVLLGGIGMLMLLRRRR